MSRRQRLPRHRHPALGLVVLLALVPLLSGCLTKSENVGDQYSGFVVVAAAPDAGATPTFDVPASMAGSVSVTKFPADGDTQTSPEPAQTDAVTGKVGSRMTFTDLTAGQFSQLGDIISGALDSGATVDLTATRSGDVVRMRGGAALAGLSPKTSYLSITVDFGGEVVATNGHLAGDNSVTWVPEPGQNAQFNADAKYPDPATAALPSWTWFMVIACLAIVGAVAALAYRFRDRTPRYTPPAGQGGGPNPLRALTRLRRKKNDDAAAASETEAEEIEEPAAPTGR
ncbi:LppM family (lipo)protein [Gordonia sp. FQ]|uniref:LppM family (lipo)protein n=1 Tax=Gordonia sp. FQ TaxID=3446634 RepID=UPI003F842124